MIRQFVTLFLLLSTLAFSSEILRAQSYAQDTQAAIFAHAEQEMNFGQVAQVQNTIRIWDGTSVDCPKVTLTAYLPQDTDSDEKTAADVVANISTDRGTAGSKTESRFAVIICPGGSYCWLDYKTEGEGVAKWLKSNGIAAFVLRYRTAGFWSFFSHDRLIFRRRQYPDMIEDIQRAIQIVRENAGVFDVDPQKIGVMGFSAGGHLSLMAGSFFNTDFLSPLCIDYNVSLRPDFVAAIYPVVTMSDKYLTHNRSRRGVLGEYRCTEKVWRDSLSMEKHIPDDMPPVFLMNCLDDPVVKYQNSELLEIALRTKGIEHKYIQYKTGGHGFGADREKTSEESIGWCKEFLEWIGHIFPNNTDTGSDIDIDSNTNLITDPDKNHETRY